MKKRPPLRQRGFTLVEVMVATIVLGVAFVGSTSLIVHTRKSLITARQRRMAMAVAETTLDQYKTAASITEGTFTDNVTMGNYTFILTRHVNKVEERRNGPNALEYAYYDIGVTVSNATIPHVYLETIRRKL